MRKYYINNEMKEERIRMIVINKDGEGERIYMIQCRRSSHRGQWTIAFRCLHSLEYRRTSSSPSNKPTKFAFEFWVVEFFCPPIYCFFFLQHIF